LGFSRAQLKIIPWWGKNNSRWQKYGGGGAKCITYIKVNNNLETFTGTRLLLRATLPLCRPAFGITRI